MNRRYTCIVIMSAGMLAATRFSSAAPVQCEQLAELRLDRTEITRAEMVAQGSFTPPTSAAATTHRVYSHLPSFCRVAGTIRPTSDSNIRFEVWMPGSNWNGKFVGVGNGAWAGTIMHDAMLDPLSKGYATASTDGGHQGSPFDASFASDHPEQLIDWGHRALHETTIAAKAAINAFYGKHSDRSLFVSCSTGGRQGLMAAYRYPDDFDGIASMAPANPVANLMVGSLWTSHATLKDAASNIPPSKFALAHKAAVKACDADDGVTDNIISAPLECRFDPVVLQCKADDAADCLSSAQVTALRAIYQGPRNPRTNQPIFPGLQAGSEAMLPIHTAEGAPFPAVLSYFRDLIFGDPSWDFRSFDFDRDTTRALGAHSAIVDVPPTGLDNYFATGRKLLLSQGWADPLIPPMSTVNFYRGLGKGSGEGARLFMIPGMGHCAGGDGPFVFDALAIIDEWVETRRAPERIVVGNPPGKPKRTRPLCPFPERAVYSGTGSTDDAKNFRCEHAR